MQFFRFEKYQKLFDCGGERPNKILLLFSPSHSHHKSLIINRSFCLFLADANENWRRCWQMDMTRATWRAGPPEPEHLTDELRLNDWLTDWVTSSDIKTVWHPSHDEVSRSTFYYRGDRDWLFQSSFSRSCDVDQQEDAFNQRKDSPQILQNDTRQNITDPGQLSAAAVHSVRTQQSRWNGH